MEQALQLFDEVKKIPKMPSEYMGVTQKSGGYTKTAPRVWTNEEIHWLQEMLQRGYSKSEIAESMGRSEVSLQIKIKRLGKQNRTYNAEHVTEKYYTNMFFAEVVQPESVLDLYCGTKKFWEPYCKHYVSNDKDKTVSATYNELAERLIHKLYYEGEQFDLIDLDPFGSAYECFDLAIKMAKKAFVVTLGEMGHKRFKRLDYVSRFYGICTLEDFTVSNIIKHIQTIGSQNKKGLSVWQQLEWRNTARVWFLIKPIKINCWK